ncbi:MAG: NADH:ubiquinone reductase (Na(+)-transporting) subunit C [Saprospiraceae bacterium]|nr:NADH:ubiquinone reductase (Na(+)-transporting) subunit C [Saprospiraceae bacterium]
MDSTNYIVRFTLVMTVLASLILAGMFYATKPAADKNQVVFTKRAILAAVETRMDKKLKDISDDEVLTFFDENVEQVTLNMSGEVVDGVQAEKVDLAQEKKKPEADRLLPLFVFNGKDGKKYYIFSVRGNGLWDEIWGYIALEEDMNTVAGAAFDHKGETPGLGAEIKDNPSFPKQFLDKKIFNEKGELVSINVRKGGAQDPVHEVDAISGATITSVGVSEMMKRGLNYYKPYIEKNKATSMK